MAIAGTLALQGRLTGAPGGAKELGLQWVITAGVDTVTTTTWASGDNTITVPTGTTVVCIVPPTGNANALKLKGAAGDTGVLISKTKPTVLAWDTGASFILNAAGSTAGEVSFA